MRSDSFRRCGGPSHAEKVGAACGAEAEKMRPPNSCVLARQSMMACESGLCREHSAGTIVSLCRLSCAGQQPNVWQNGGKCRACAINAACDRNGSSGCRHSDENRRLAVAKKCLLSRQAIERRLFQRSVLAMRRTICRMMEMGTRWSARRIRCGFYFAAPVQGLSVEARRRPTIAPVGA